MSHLQNGNLLRDDNGFIWFTMMDKLSESCYIHVISAAGNVTCSHRMTFLHGGGFEIVFMTTLSQAGWRWSPCCVALPHDHLSIKKWHNGMLQLPASVTVHQKESSSHFFQPVVHLCLSLHSVLVRWVQFEFGRVIHTQLHGLGKI